MSKQIMKKIVLVILTLNTKYKSKVNYSGSQSQQINIFSITNAYVFYKLNIIFRIG